MSAASSPANIRLIFAANRSLGVSALQALLQQDIRPVGLLVPHSEQQDDSVCQMRRLLPDVPTLRGTEFRTSSGQRLLRSLRPDYLVSIHFPLLIPTPVLSIPRHGALNLHPGLLPFTRGWHTPSWAILKDEPYGATLHWMDDGLDSGDIALQQEVPILPEDTANSLYARVLAAELDLFQRAIPLLRDHTLPRTAQPAGGSLHRRRDLAAQQAIQLDEPTTARALLRQLRALSTNCPDEHAWFEDQGRRYRVQISLTSESEDGDALPNAA